MNFRILFPRVNALKGKLLPIFILCGFSFARAWYDIPPKPDLQTAVYDYANLLSQADNRQLSTLLLRYSDRTSTQIVNVIINSTKGENINYLGAQWGEQWGIGDKDKDNGILIIVAKSDRKVAINTGRGVEHLLTDALSRRIIENIIVPQFKKEQYFEGLTQASGAIFKVLSGEFKQDKRLQKRGFPIWSLMLVVLVVIYLILRFRNRRGGGNSGNRRGGIDLLDVMILGSLGRYGGGGFGQGGSGGGFGSGGFGGGFGGGSFGGGGAGGSW